MLLLLPRTLSICSSSNLLASHPLHPWTRGPADNQKARKTLRDGRVCLQQGFHPLRFHRQHCHLRICFVLIERYKSEINDESVANGAKSSNFWQFISSWMLAQMFQNLAQSYLKLKYNQHCALCTRRAWCSRCCWCSLIPDLEQRQGTQLAIGLQISPFQSQVQLTVHYRSPPQAIKLVLADSPRDSTLLYPVSLLSG